MLRILAVSLLLALSTGCGPGRAPIAPGTVPGQEALPVSEEQYGHQVFSELTERYRIDNDDVRINRVQEIVDRLTNAAGASSNPWHVHVLVDDGFVNAAATRGNYIFVWTGLLKKVIDDGELSTVLAHEIGHVLAGHTTPTPEEETQRIVAQGLGVAAREVLKAQGGYVGLLAGLAEAAVRSIAEAGLVNPEQQRKELEADQIGLFLMADAKLDPEIAVRFWERVQTDPAFSGGFLQFLSSHPSSEERLVALQAFLPDALARFEAAQGGRVVRTSSVPGSKRGKPEGAKPAKSAGSVTPMFGDAFALETWIVQEGETDVFNEPGQLGKISTSLSQGTRVTVRENLGRWLEIVEPVEGFVRSRDLSPE